MLYKGEFNVSAPVEIDMVGVPAVVVQFFSEIKLRLFETKFNGALPNRSHGCPTWRPLSPLGTSHSGTRRAWVPVLAKIDILLYLVGGVDLAVTHLCVEELPSATQYVVEQVMSNALIIILRL